MSHPYDPQCPHCTPALMHPETGNVYPDDSPEMRAIMRVWNGAPFKQRTAYIAVTVHNSRDPHDLSTVAPLLNLIERALKALGTN
jgi:hypothetical protein